MALAQLCQGQTLYSFGNLTAEEQLYMEFINRARANPTAEGVRLADSTDPDVVAAMLQFSVDKTMLKSEFSALPVLPPLVPNASLTTSARSHSAWMLANSVQAHDETNPANTPFTRMVAAGYTYSTAGENVYAYSKSVWHGHAGFEVDWGTGGTGGMQAGRGHRVNIHSSAFREIGVGMAIGSNGTVGPQLVTQDFGSRTGIPSLGTGVAYYDLNTNNFYDIGEGIAGLTVNVSDATYYCTTAIGGGWVVPMPTTAAATRTVTFSGLNVNQTASLVLPLSNNAKADLKLTYAPPSITSAATAPADSPHTVAFTAVGGATAYKWNRWTSSTAAAENCENTTNITRLTPASFAVVNTTIKQAGAASFHIVNETGLSSNWIQLNPVYYGQASPSISFQSSVRYAMTVENFKVQVKEEGGATAWVDVYSQAGSGGAGESTFTLRSAALTAMAGKAFRVRFLLDPGNGSRYGATESTTGWFIDAIAFSGVSGLANQVTQTLAGTSGSFTPSLGSYLMSVAPVISSLDFPASYQTLTISAAVPAAPAFTTQPASTTISTGNTATFTVATSGSAPTFQWYLGNAGTTTSPISGATAATYTTPALGATTNYWVRATNGLGTADSTTATVTIAVAPAITTQPAASTTINSGGTTTLTVAASGTSPTFQWYAGNTGVTTSPIAGATSATYTTPALSSAASYWVRATNIGGTVDSATAAVAIRVAPAITTQPGSTTVSSGGTATLTVAASGTSPTFQWYVGNTGVTTSPISGATSVSYTTPALTVTTSYWARATNPAGTADSSAATVTVAIAPAITTQPVSVTINSGTATTLSVAASGTSPTFQWYSGNSGVTTAPISGATGASYTTPALTTATSYWVRASNAVGTADSSTATVSMTPPPAITTQPASPVIKSGTAATLTVVASSTSLTYQWYSGTSPSTKTKVTGATSATYTTPNLSATATYWVRVTNSAGTADSITATITMAVAPTISTQPVSVTINSGNTATLTVATTGSQPTFQWYAGASGVITNPVAGATAPSFTTPTLTATTSYWVRATNAAASADSSAATVTVITPPVITTQPVSTTVNSGGTTTLTVAATGTSPTLQWFAGPAGVTTNPISGATAASFTTPALTASATYWARASNAAGTAVSTAATVSINTPFAAWATNFETANSLAPGTIGTQANGDYDNDGTSNLIEYAFGTSPVVAGGPAPRMPVLSLTVTDLVIRYQRDTALTDIIYTPQACPTMTNWKAPGEIAGFTDVLISSAGTIETREAKLPKNVSGHCFMRVQITQP